MIIDTMIAFDSEVIKFCHFYHYFALFTLAEQTFVSHILIRSATIDNPFQLLNNRRARSKFRATAAYIYCEF